MKDLIIVGAGPAGLTAGIYAARRELKTSIVSKNIGGQVLWASEIENYPGFKNIQSFELIERMKDQVLSLGVEILNKEVFSIVKQENGSFLLTTEDQKIEALCVLLCLGLFPRRLAIKGEIELAGKGVTYCANCDAPFYRNKNVMVVGGGNAALDAAEILSKIAKKVTLVHRNENFKAFEVLLQKVKSTQNIEIIVNAEPVEIIGNNKVEKVKIKIGSDKIEEIIADGVFIEIGRIAHTDFVSELVERNEKKEIIVDEYCRTKTEGLFAAGDTTQIPFKQISSANGQATIAALSVYQYLQLKEGKKVKQVFDRGSI